MEKGIVYIICSLFIASVVLLSTQATIQEIDKHVQPKIVYVKTPVVVTPTIAPTATPSATLKRVVVPTHAVVK